MGAVDTVNDLAQYGPAGLLLGLALIAIGVMYRNEVRARHRAEDRADRWEQRFVEESKRRRADD